MKKFTLLTLAALTAFLMAARSAPADRFDNVVRGRFFAGLAGNRAALDDAMKTCEDILAENPNHAEALVWYGAGTLRKAGEAFRNGDPAQGAELFTKAMADMDKAVELAPDHVGVRAPRGAAVLIASRFMSQTMAKPLLDRGLADYEHVLKLQSGHFDKLGTHPRGELLFGLAEGWSRAGDASKAEAFFSRVAADLPGTVYATRAAKWLQTRTLAPGETGCVGCHAGK